MAKRDTNNQIVPLCTQKAIVQLPGEPVILYQSQEQLFNGIYYQTDDAGNAVITGMEGNFSVLDIPSSIDGYPVTAISESAFQQKTALKSVTIPDSVTTIGSSAFRGCTALKTIKGM